MPEITQQSINALMELTKESIRMSLVTNSGIDKLTDRIDDLLQKTAVQANINAHQEKTNDLTSSEISTIKQWQGDHQTTIDNAKVQQASGNKMIYALVTALIISVLAAVAKIS